MYEPGARIRICTDERVFSGSVGIAEEDVINCQSGIRTLLARLEVRRLDLWGLDDVHPELWPRICVAL
ncbi:L-tyrosine/L-tryptophan isonitrile synthase family protein [Nocardia sp. NPDC019255]|uniref:L-tyrosine/L-tryptophan isonitrile synthase family protein n=1 Tax=Nocardia sp. NPDC019255 TaxID=3154591 RepID=UPI0033D121B6